MHLAVYLPLLVPLLDAVAARPLAGRLPLAALVRIPLVDSLGGMFGR